RPEVLARSEGPVAPAAAPVPLPVAGYDALSASAVVASLAGLDDDQLDAVRAHEVATKGRRTVLAAIDRRLGATAPAAAERATAKKATVKEATVEQAGAGKATTKESAAKKAAAKKATTKKAT